MKSNIEYKFSMKEKVLIKSIEVRGHIDACSTDERGEMYRVVYWNDGCRNSVWMYDYELEETK